MPDITPDELARIKREALEELLAGEFEDKYLVNKTVVRAWMDDRYPAPPKRVRADTTERP